MSKRLEGKAALITGGHREIVNHFDPNFVKVLHGRFAR